MRTGTDREPREHDGVTSTFRGLATIRHHAEDLAAAKAWYSELLGVEPYFDTPDYVEFRLGDHSQELGVSRTPSAPAGVVAYWHVDDVGAVWERLLSLGARSREAPRDHGHGFVAGAAVDPFGNLLGVMYNPHFAEMAAAPPGVTPAPAGG
ncbi:glyoxalase/bleomycin resistance/dioxygenase family protein [Streptomyces sp. SID8377]|nr:glyoxalase/bleomycin resistance/dioxygenase family protein [Streptomyces sp. SID8377]